MYSRHVDYHRTSLSIELSIVERDGLVSIIYICWKQQNAGSAETIETASTMLKHQKKKKIKERKIM